MHRMKNNSIWRKINLYFDNLFCIFDSEPWSKFGIRISMFLWVKLNLSSPPKIRRSAQLDWIYRNIFSNAINFLTTKPTDFRKNSIWKLNMNVLQLIKKSLNLIFFGHFRIINNFMEKLIDQKLRWHNKQVATILGLVLK